MIAFATGLQGAGIAAALCAHLQEVLPSSARAFEALQQLAPTSDEASDVTGTNSDATGHSCKAASGNSNPDADDDQKIDDSCSSKQGPHGISPEPCSNHIEHKPNRVLVSSSLACMEPASRNMQRACMQQDMASDSARSGSAYARSMPGSQPGDEITKVGAHASTKDSRDQAAESTACPVKQFRFAMLFSGYVPQAPKILQLWQRSTCINIPSYHCFGNTELDRQVGPQASCHLASWFSEKNTACVVKQHGCGHMVPSSKADAVGYLLFFDDAIQMQKGHQFGLS